MLNLEPIRQRLGDFRDYGITTDPATVVSVNGLWAPVMRQGCTYEQIYDDLSDLLREVERLRAENEELRNK